MAAEDSTQVTAGGQSFSLDAGEFRLVEIAGSSASGAHTRVTSNRPIIVAQFSMTTIFGKTDRSFDKNIT